MNKDTALLNAVGANIELLNAAANGNLAHLCNLLKDGANVNYSNSKKQSALMLALSNGRYEVAEYLINYNGTNLNAVDKLGKSVFAYAAIYGDLATITEIVAKFGAIGEQLLLQQLTNVDKDGKSALMFAAANTNDCTVANYLLELYINKRRDINICDNDSRSLLFHACKNGRIDLVDILLGYGAEIDNKDTGERTAFITAVIHNHIRIVELLHRRGADINCPDGAGKTALIHAASSGHIDIIDWLLYNGSNIHHLDKNDKSAVYYAWKKKYNRAVEMLYYAGAVLYTKADDSSQQVAIKTKLCKHWKDTGTCKYGAGCLFVHAEVVSPWDEISLPCKYWKEGDCPFGNSCAFIHEEGIIEYGKGIVEYEQLLPLAFRDLSEVKCVNTAARFFFMLTLEARQYSISWVHFYKLVELSFKVQKNVITSKMLFDAAQIHTSIIHDTAILFMGNGICISQHIFANFPILLQGIESEECRSGLVYHILAHFYMLCFTSMEIQEIVSLHITSAEQISITLAEQIELLNFKKVLSLILHVTPNLNKDVCCIVARLLVIGNAYRGNPSIDKRGYIKACSSIFNSIIGEKEEVVQSEEVQSEEVQSEEVPKGTLSNPFKCIEDGGDILNIATNCRFLPVALLGPGQGSSSQESSSQGSSSQAFIEVSLSNGIYIWGSSGLSVPEKETVVEQIINHILEYRQWSVGFYKYLKDQDRKFNGSEISTNIDKYFKVVCHGVGHTFSTLFINGGNICKCFPDLEFDKLIDNTQAPPSTKCINISDLHLSHYLFLEDVGELMDYWERIYPNVKINISPDFNKMDICYTDTESLESFQSFLSEGRDLFSKKLLLCSKEYSARDVDKLDKEQLKLLSYHCKVCLIKCKNNTLVRSLYPSNIKKFEKKLEDPSKFLEYLKLKNKEICDVYVDASNIIIGASINADRREDPEIMLDFTNTILVVGGGRNMDRVYVAGSSRDISEQQPLEGNGVWSRWGANSEICIKKRLSDKNGKQHEEGVDELLHNKILEDIDKGGTMLLLSGDGNDNNGNTTFPDIIMQVLDTNIWTVELWCWKRNISSNWIKLANRYKDTFSIHYLDDYRHAVTYKNRAIRAGSAAVTVPKAAVTVPKAAITVPKAAVTVPKAAVTVPKSAVTVLKAAASKSSASKVGISAPKAEAVSKVVRFADSVKVEAVSKVVRFADSVKAVSKVGPTVSKVEVVSNADAVVSNADDVITIEYVIMKLYEFLVKNEIFEMRASELGNFYKSHPECKKLYQAKTKAKKFYSDPLAQQYLLWKDDAIGGKEIICAVINDKTCDIAADRQCKYNKISAMEDVEGFTCALHSFILGRGGSMDAAALSMFYHHHRKDHPEYAKIYKRLKKNNESLPCKMLLWKNDPSAPGMEIIYALGEDGNIIKSMQISPQMHIQAAIPMNEEEDYGNYDWTVDEAPNPIRLQLIADFDFDSCANCVQLNNYAHYLYTVPKDYNKAETVFLHALSIEGDNVILLCNYGHLLILMQRVSDAYQIFQKALAIDRSNIDVLANIEYCNKIMA